MPGEGAGEEGPPHINRWRAGTDCADCRPRPHAGFWRPRDPVARPQARRQECPAGQLPWAAAALSCWELSRMPHPPLLVMVMLVHKSAIPATPAGMHEAAPGTESCWQVSHGAVQGRSCAPAAQPPLSGRAGARSRRCERRRWPRRLRLSPAWATPIAPRPRCRCPHRLHPTTWRPSATW